MMTETIRHLELLHRTCQRKGWALCLRIDPSTSLGGFAQPREQPSRLTYLEVIEPTLRTPHATITRRVLLDTGSTICRCSLSQHATIEAAALAVIAALARNDLEAA